ncbi:hypothetical protein ACFCX4_32800 [Kitasatospora sp. NPDC056327]|uniref:hypothetical protein n=1 Tax=Kitasatospora sp. NPDC056327 TaxID=3345785 RepID=UPI0035DA0481
MSKRTSRTAAVAAAMATVAALAVGSAGPAVAGPYPGGVTISSPPVEPGTYSSELKAANGNGDSVSLVTVGDVAQGGPVRTYLLIWTVGRSTHSLDLLPGDTGASAAGINNALTVIGTSRSQTSGAQHAVRWTTSATPVELPPLPGDSTAAPAAISDTGTAVGTSWDSAAGHAVAWPPSGAAVALPPLPGDAGSAAVAVNASGRAVGHSYAAGAGGAPRAVTWAPDGTVTALAVPAGYVSSSATRVTDTGIVIGTGRPGGPSAAEHALVWNAAGAVADLGPGSLATAVNNGGTVVGSAGGQAARWAIDGTPLPLAPTALASVATAVNDQGVVVGYTSDPPPARAQYYAQRWNPDGSVFALPQWSQAYPHSRPSFITNSRIVVGELILRGNANYGRPFVLRWDL